MLVWFYYSCSTFQKECSFTAKVRCNRDGQELFIDSMNDSHNHDIIEVGSHMLCIIVDMLYVFCAENFQA